MLTARRVLHLFIPLLGGGCAGTCALEGWRITRVGSGGRGGDISPRVRRSPHGRISRRGDGGSGARAVRALALWEGGLGGREGGRGGKGPALWWGPVQRKVPRVPPW